MTSKLMSLREWKFFASVRAAVVETELVMLELEAGGSPTYDGLLSVVHVLLSDIRGICDDYEATLPGLSRSTRSEAKDAVAEQSIDAGDSGYQWNGGVRTERLGDAAGIGRRRLHGPSDAD